MSTFCLLTKYPTTRKWPLSVRVKERLGEAKRQSKGLSCPSVRTKNKQDAKETTLLRWYYPSRHYAYCTDIRSQKYSLKRCQNSQCVDRKDLNKAGEYINQVGVVKGRMYLPSSDARWMAVLPFFVVLFTSSWQSPAKCFTMDKCPPTVVVNEQIGWEEGRWCDEDGDWEVMIGKREHRKQ